MGRPRSSPGTPRRSSCSNTPGPSRFRDAVVESGGVLADNIRIPGAVVDELLAELAELSDD